MIVHLLSICLWTFLLHSKTDKEKSLEILHTTLYMHPKPIEGQQKKVIFERWLECFGGPSKLLVNSML